MAKAKKKKPRTAAQRAATRRMLEAAAARRGEVYRPRKKGAKKKGAKKKGAHAMAHGVVKRVKKAAKRAGRALSTQARLARLEHATVANNAGLRKVAAAVVHLDGRVARMEPLFDAVRKRFGAGTSQAIRQLGSG